MNTTTRRRLCRMGRCTFAPVGTLRVVSTANTQAAYSYGLCSLHRDEVADDAITSPKVATVEWRPLSAAQWANDGATACARHGGGS